MPPAGFEPTISASERPQTHALDSAATGICGLLNKVVKYTIQYVDCRRLGLYVVSSGRHLTFNAAHYSIDLGISRAERDGTRAETRFRLSPKRTSPFKSVGASFQSTAVSRGVRISLSNAG